MKLATRPKKRPNGVGGRRDIAERQRIDALDRGEEIDGESHAEEAAVKRHAAMPHRGNLRGVVPEEARLIEQHEAEPPADDDAERDPKEKVVGLRDRHRGLSAPQLRPRHEIAPVEPAEHDAGHVSEPIPANGKRPEFDRNGIDDRVGDHEKLHGTPQAWREKAGGPSPWAAPLSRRRNLAPLAACGAASAAP